MLCEIHAFLFRFTLCVVCLLIFVPGGRGVVDRMLVCVHAHGFIPENILERSSPIRPVCIRLFRFCSYLSCMPRVHVQPCH